jgi:hypothetical protein
MRYVVRRAMRYVVRGARARRGMLCDKHHVTSCLSLCSDGIVSNQIQKVRFVNI